MAITLRTLNYTDQPGIVFLDPSVKSAPLTNAEIDQNFVDIYNLVKTRVAKAGDTLTGKLIFAPSNPTRASYNISVGTAPSSPVNGDVWATVDGIFYHVGGTTLELVTADPIGGISGSGASLTTLNATELTFGTVPTERLSGTYNISITGSAESANTATSAQSATTATRLATPRTIALSGDVTGSATFDGSANITITAVVGDNSHNHTSTPGNYSVGGDLTVTGDVTINGGDIILNGVGRIQGIDTVTAATDAASKAYVDNAVIVAQGSASVNISNQSGTNTNFYMSFTDQTTGAENNFGIDVDLIYNPSVNTLSAGNFNSTSDARLKENVYTIPSGLDIVNSLRGVEFDWIKSGEHSAGVIAQELQQVIPHAVSDVGTNLSVNYNQIIAYLIEAVKELDKKVKELSK